MAKQLQVRLRPVRSLSVKTVGSSSGSSDTAYYQKWLELDAGNPFSRYADNDAVIGGTPSDS